MHPIRVRGSIFRCIWCIFEINYWFHPLQLIYYINIPSIFVNVKYSLNIRELFWRVKIKIRIFGRNQKINIYKTVNWLTQKATNIYIFNIWTATEFKDRIVSRGISILKGSKLCWDNLLTTLWFNKMRERVEKVDILSRNKSVVSLITHYYYKKLVIHMHHTNQKSL